MMAHTNNLEDVSHARAQILTLSFCYFFKIYFILAAALKHPPGSSCEAAAVPNKSANYLREKPRDCRQLPLCRVKVKAPAHQQASTLVYVFKGCPSLAVLRCLSVKGEQFKVLNERIRGAWKSTPLTRSVLVLRELGPAGAASHHGRPSDGAQCLAVCTCVQQQPAPLMLTVHTPDVRARAYVCGNLESGGRLSTKMGIMKERPTCLMTLLHPTHV